ncbi:hypothetical protein NKG94_15645 [Micromonospora sp. M12]
MRRHTGGTPPRAGQTHPDELRDRPAAAGRPAGSRAGGHPRRGASGRRPGRSPQSAAGAPAGSASAEAAGLLVATSTASVTGGPGRVAPVAVHVTNPGTTTRRVTVGLRSPRRPAAWPPVR